MNAQRKKIIIAEINYWKQNKLLPEHYCDFLITLYSQGNHEQEIHATEAILFKEKKKLKARAFFIQLVYIVVAFAVLGSSIKLWSVFFAGETLLLVGILIVNCLLWLFAGRLFKLLYFTISGASGLVFIVFYIMKSIV
ncbi:hypothetical protein [Sporosarcina sp. UB5]|uniref:hypothetical protein n=1 Tax=Sporosarcina sp. UB5 TaxID=3047463 RepID=UPI003D7BD90B